MSTQQDIYAAGFKSCPPMLNKENYVSWSSRLLRYAKSRLNGKLIHNSIINGPYVRRMILEPGDVNREVTVTETFHVQTDDELTDKELKQIEADDQAIQTILLDLPEDIYAATQDPLALMANSNNPYAFPAPHQDQSSFNQNYMQQTMPNPEDITDPTTAMNMALTLMAKAFKLNYSTPTNNNQRISLNPRNMQIAQPGMNMGQDRQMQMVGGNGGNQFRQYAGQNAGNLTGYQNGLIGVQGNGNHNQNVNGNLVAARAEGNAAGQNGNQIRCYNCRGVGHYARNCTFRPKRRDAAYLQTQLLIAQKEEAGIHLQAEEYDLMATAADLDEIKDVNANCILMANLQQASTSGTQNDKAPVYDLDGSAEVYENCDDNEIFNMFTQEEQYTELLEPIPEPHQINALHLSTDKQIMTLNEQISDLNKQLSKEKSIVSFLIEEKKKLKSDFNTHEDELLDKQIQLEKKIKELNNILVKMGQSIQTIHMLSPKPDSFYHTEQKMALVIKILFISSKLRRNNKVYDTTPSVARKFLNEVKSTIVTLQCVVKHRMTIEPHNWSSSAHQELHKIVKDENFPIVNYVDARVQNFEIQFLKEAAKFVGDFKSLANEADASLAKHKTLEFEIELLLKAVVNQDIMNIVQKESVGDKSDLQTELEQKMLILRLHTRTSFTQIFMSRTQTKTIIASLQNELQSTIYKNAKLRTQLFKKVSDQKDTTHDTSVNTKFSKQSIVENLPKVGETHALLNPVTSNSVSTPQEPKVMKNDKVITPGMFKINPVKTSREEKHVPNTVRASNRTKSITVSQPPVITKKDVNSDTNGLSSTGVDNTKTRRPQPSSNTKNDRVPSASKSSRSKNKEAKVEEHHRNLLLSKNNKHISYACNNIKIDSQNVISKICLWCVDSGCSKHMTGNLKLLINFIKKFMGTALFGNEHVAAILGFGDLQNDLVSGLPKFKYHKEHLCPSCEQGKSKRASHPPKPVPNSRQSLHLLRMDLCGPMRIASINGKRYVLVIVDENSCYTWVHFLRSKDEAPEVKENQEKDKIGSKPDKNGKRGKASNKVIMSSVNLVPILSEFEGILDTMCDVHLVNNPTPLEAKYHFEVVINSNDDISSSDNDFLYNENIEYVETLPHDSELVSLEVAEIVIPKDEEIEDDNLQISSGSTTTRSDISLPDYEAFSFSDDHIEEISSGSTTTHFDISLSKYDSFIFVLLKDQNLPDSGELIYILNSEIRENLSTTRVNLSVEDDYSLLLTYVVWIFLAYLTYPVIPPYLHSFGNEDTIFDPGIAINYFYSFKSGLSHRCGTLKKFNTHRSHLNESPMEMLFSTCSPMN
nr:Gag-Pol polyprotein [Tanacetum cinerariifolium]